MTHKIRRSFLLLLAVFLCSPLAWAEEQPPVLGFADFYGRVLDYYPQLKAKNADVEAAVGRKLQAAAGFWPTVHGLTSATVSDDPSHVFSYKLKQEAFTQPDFDLNRLNTPRHRTNYNFTLQTELPLFDAFQTISRTRSAKKNSEAVGQEALFTRMEARLLASEAYLRALATDRLLEVVEGVVQESTEDLKQAQDLKDQGMILGADYYAARVALGQFIGLRNQLQRQKQENNALLNILMGEDPAKIWLVRGKLGGDPWPRRELPGWLETACLKRPDLSALESRAQAQADEVKRERATILPDVRLFGSVSEDTDTLGESGGESFSVGVKGRIDLFDPARKGRVRSVEAERGKLEHQKIALKDAITRDVASEYYRLAGFLDNLSILKDMVTDAREAVDLTLPLYREGRKSIVDLLGSRRVFLETSQAYYQLQLGIKTSGARLLFLSGELGDSQMKDLAKRIGVE